jgi:hypothetical protein
MGCFFTISLVTVPMVDRNRTAARTGHRITDAPYRIRPAVAVAPISLHSPNNSRAARWFKRIALARLCDTKGLP